MEKSKIKKRIKSKKSKKLKNYFKILKDLGPFTEKDKLRSCLVDKPKSKVSKKRL